MKNKTSLTLLAVVLLAFGVYSAGRAQSTASGTSVQQTATRNDAATVAGTSATSAATITIAANGSQYFYLTGIDIMNCAGSSAVTAAAPTTITTTNLAGSPAWTVGSGVTAGLCTNQTVNFGTPLKSAVPGTATTFVLPTFATNQTIRANVYGFYAQ